MLRLASTEVFLQAGEHVGPQHAKWMQSTAAAYHNNEAPEAEWHAGDFGLV